MIPPADSTDKTIVLPVCDLNTSKVLLPGVIYLASLPHSSALSILGRFKHLVSAHPVAKLLLIDVGGEQTSNSMAAEAGIELIITLEHDSVTFDPYSSQKSATALEKVVFMSKSPSPTIEGVRAQEIFTVVRVIAIEADDSNTIMTLRAIMRARRNEDYHMTLPKGEIAVQIDLSLYSRPHGPEYASLTASCDRLFKRIEVFKNDYLHAMKAESSETQNQYRTLLIMNPLANALFVQFSGSKEFGAAFGRLKRLIPNSDAKTDELASTNLYVQLIDLVGAVMPFPSGAKLELLTAFDLDKRKHLFGNMLQLFVRVFDHLKEDAGYLDDWFVEATNSQKEDLIALQLRSVRKVLDDVERKSDTKPLPSKLHNRKDSSRSPHRKSKVSLTPDPGKRSIASKSSRNQNMLTLDQNDDELEEIYDFVTKVLPGIISLPDDAKRLIGKDFKRLLACFKSGATSSLDANILRSYLEVVIDIPWDRFSSGSQSLIDIDRAKQQLDADHYGLNKVKTRLLQYLVVLKLLSIDAKKLMESEAIDIKIPTTTLSAAKQSLESAKAIQISKQNKLPIIMLVGPPGVGKTSLAKSIASSLGRDFQRVSLGGIKDQSDIRGHRRTYVGAMPGLVIQALRRSRSMDPVILLDEIDKVTGSHLGSSRANGDPAAALLEVLDPEQNSSFTDHYLGIPVDLSQVIFVCTANNASTIPAPLLDRLEIIELGSYELDEKVVIGKRFLLPRQVKRNGFPSKPNSDEFVIIPEALFREIITDYTSEAGVRGLDRMLATICRNKAVDYCDSIDPTSLLLYNPEIHSEDLNKYLGAPNRIIDTSAVMTTTTNRSTIGIVNGLSYNSSGFGSVLVFECVGIDRCVANKNDSKSGPSLSMTGRLGEVLLESARIALIYVKLLVFRDLLKVDGLQERSLIDKLNSTEFYLHVPFGSIPKDGPSAGVTITLLFLSLVLCKDVPPDIAMTGEITLRGLVLPVGGIKEKIMGARMNGNIKRIIVPRDNRRDLIADFQRRLSGEDGLIEVNMDEIWTDDKNLHFQSRRVEEDIASRYGITIHYAQEFYDVIKVVWGEDEQLSLTTESRQSEQHL